MKLLSWIIRAAVLIPIALLLAKWLGWLHWSWLVVAFVASGIPLAVFLSILVLAIWVIRQVAAEWELQ